MHRLARSTLFVSLLPLIVAACGESATCSDPLCGGDNSGGPTISSVSPSPMVEGQSAVLTGTDFSPNAASNTVTMNNVTLQVTAASETSLTITIPEGCGPLRAASLQVTVAGRAGSIFSSTVAPDPTGPTLQDVALAVGEQVVYRQPRHCLGLPTGGGSARYLLGIQSTGRDGSVTRDVIVDGMVTGAALAAPAPPVASSKAAVRRPSPPSGDFGASATRALLQRHREGHDALMADLIRPVRDPARRSGAFTAQGAPARTVVNGSEVVGDSVELRVRNSAGDCSLSSTTTVTAELRVKTARSMWWVDVDNPPDGFQDADLQTLSTLFDDVILDTEIAEFGPVNDIDGNERIAILVTQQINADADSGGRTLGFVNPCDFFPRDDATDFTASNEGEFFYAIAPDPVGVVGDTLSVEALLNIMPIILAHEFAHIIQVSRRVASPTALDFMAAFVVEGQATLAEEVVGHVALGNTAGQNLGADMAFDFPDVQPIPWYFSPFADLAFYFGLPGSPDDPRRVGAPQECTWIDDDVDHPCGGRPLWYGVTWSFLRWASDLYGPALGGEAAFQAALIDGDLSGFDNLEEALAGQGTLEDHLARWAATLFMDDRPGASAENSMASWNLFDMSLGLVDVAWLHPVEHPFTNFADTVTVRDPSTAYFLVGGSGFSNHNLRITTPDGSDLGSDVQVWLVRTQ
jgi:hypothetical protein